MNKYRIIIRYQDGTEKIVPAEAFLLFSSNYADPEKLEAIEGECNATFLIEASKKSVDLVADTVLRGAKRFYDKRMGESQ